MGVNVGASTSAIERIAKAADAISPPAAPPPQPRRQEHGRLLPTRRIPLVYQQIPNTEVIT